MNYEKKRKRQNGRQVPSESERQKIYREVFYTGQAFTIERMIAAKILPRFDFNLEPIALEEFKKDYECSK